jgi:hypothetical protein
MHVWFSRPLVWRLDGPWEPVRLDAFGVSVQAIFTEHDRASDSEDGIGLNVLKTREGWTHVSSRSLLLEGHVPDGGVFALLNQLVQRLRFASGQVSIPRLPLVVSTRGNALPLPLPDPEPLGPGALLNRVWSGAPITQESCREAGRARDVPAPYVLLADAAEAVASCEPVRAILYSAFAAETCSRFAVDRRVRDALESASQDYRIVGVHPDRRDEVLDALLARAERNADTLLHELPLYLSRCSLKRDVPDLWHGWTRLKKSRNKIVHEGRFDLEPDERIAVDQRGAEEALRIAVGVFEWWGCSARRFLDSTPAADGPDSESRGFWSP